MSKAAEVRKITAHVVNISVQRDTGMGECVESDP